MDMLSYLSNSLFSNSMGLNGWSLWGPLLILSFPFVMVIIGEMAHRLWQSGHLPLSRTLYFLRNIAIPLLFIDLLLRTVAGYEADHILIKLVDTLVGIAGINVLVSFFNSLVLAESGIAKKRGIPKLFLDILRLFLVAVGAAFVISFVWKANLGAMLTALGVGSVVLGLALQDTLGSLFTGLAMLSARNFKRGDWIRVGTQEGIVVSMNWRTVVIRTRAGDDVVLPNLYIAKQEVTKYLADDKWHIVTLEIELSFDHPPELIKRLLIEAALATPEVLKDPYPESRLWKFDDHAVVYQVRLFLANYGPRPQVASDFYSVFWYVAKRHKLIFPGRYHRFYRPPEKLVPPVFDDPQSLTDLLIETGAIPRKREVLEGLLENANHATFRDNEIILKQGEVANNFYIITKGRASIDFDTSKIDLNGKILDDLIHIQTYESGQFIVFKTMFNNGPTPLTVRAESDIEAIAIPVDDFENYLTGDPQLAHEIQQIISGREDISERILTKEIPGFADKTAASDRIEIMKGMFPN